MVVFLAVFASTGTSGEMYIYINTSPGSPSGKHYVYLRGYKFHHVSSCFISKGSSSGKGFIAILMKNGG